MKEQLSKQKLQQLHQALDRQLENISQFQLITNIPSLAQSPKVKLFKVKSHNSELEQLQKKLFNLEKKMQKIKLEEEDYDYDQLTKIQKNNVQTNFLNKIKSSKKIIDKGKSPQFDLTKQKSITKSSKKKLISLDLQQSPSPVVLKRKYYQNQVKQSRKSTNNKQSKNVFKYSSNESKLNMSRKSLSQVSHKSSHSLNKNLTTAQQYSKIQRLQNQLKKYKLQNKKMKIKIKTLEVIQNRYEKLKQNFQKSQTIRKHQKQLIQNYKSKAKQYEKD